MQPIESASHPFAVIRPLRIRLLPNRLFSMSNLVVHYGLEIVTLVLMGITCVRRKENGFLFLLLAYGVSVGLGVAVGTGIVPASQVSMFVVSYVPVALTLAGWALLAFTKPRKA